MVWERTIINGDSNWHTWPDMASGGNLQGVEKSGAKRGKLARFSK